MDLTGKVLAGRYEILELVGKGGMANVYKARCNLLNRYVAVKTLKEDFKDDKELVRRFNIEAQAAASLSNPHIVSVYDVGCENGLYYIVMEYIEGKTLKAYMNEKQALPWQEAAGYAVQICDGLVEAHRNKVVHRDIKPQNIIMTADGVLKVTDFGIARATSQVTMTAGNTIGTAHYLSPEQARGGYIDARSDIYSLGIVLYEMLTAKLPFNDQTPVAIAIKHIQEQAVPPREINPSIPPALEQITLKAMAKDVNDRYSSAEEMLEDLRAVINNPDIQLSKTQPQDESDMDTTMAIPVVGADIQGGGNRRNAEREENEKRMREIENRRASKLKEKQKGKKNALITISAILAALIFIGLGGGMIYSMMGGTLFGGEKVEIPNLVDMTIDVAREKYGEQFSIIEKERVASDKPVGTIVEQDPEADKEVAKKEDIRINVKVSKGNTMLTLSDYSGQKVSDAKSALEALGLKVNINEKYSDSSEKGTVLGQEPKAGATIESGGLVTLYVSKGTDEEATEKPTEAARETEKPRATEKPVVTEKPVATKTPVIDNNDDDNNSESGSNGNGNSGSNSSSGSNSGGSGTSGGSNAGSGGAGDDTPTVDTGEDEY